MHTSSYKPRRTKHVVVAALTAFTLVLTLAPLVAFVAVPAAANAGPTAALGPELVKNGTFEHGVTGWHSADAKERLVVRHGSKRTHGSVWSARGGSLTIHDAASTVASTAPGASYVFSADLRTQFGSLKGILRVREVSASSVTTYTRSFRLANMNWESVSLTVTPKKPGAALDVSIIGLDAAPFQPLQADNVSLRATMVSAPDPTGTPTPVPVPSTSPTPSATPKPSVTPRPGITPPPRPIPTPTATASPSPAPSTNPNPAPTAGPVAPPANGCGKEPMRGTKFGVTLDIPGGMNLREAWNYAKSSYGAPEIVRIFHPGAPSGWAAADVTEGATLSVSFKIEPRDVLSGANDAKLRAWFRSAPDNIPIYWTYFHEPEDNVESGRMTASDYRAAWQRIVSISREVCHPNLYSTLILMDWTVDPKSGRDFYDYYPGSAYIDVLGWDPYNPWQNNNAYRSPASIFDKVIAVANREGKPFAVAETGSQLMGGDDGTLRAQWLKDTAAYLENKGALYVSYFDTVVEGKYDWRLKDAPSKAAWDFVIGG